MTDQNAQPQEAQKQGVCHTDDECKTMYAALSPALKASVLEMLKKQLAHDAKNIENAYKASPSDWYVPYHFYWGMSVRNTLRGRGFGEDYFGVHNLDDIYVELVEEALDLRVSNDQ